jgi:nitrous-oxide reductase
MRRPIRWARNILIVLFVGALVGSLGFLAEAAKKLPFVAENAAAKTYVPPGSFDEFYEFLSGGYNGQVSVVGLPSGRMFRILPVFSVNPENGYGYTEETKALLNTANGFIPWDDTHHVELSQSGGVPDGRWLFVNANNTPRIARIDLRTFETVETIEIPNSAGNHPSPFITPDGRYVVAGTRFSVPIPQANVPIDSFARDFKGTLSFIGVNPQTGRMAVAFQILVPGFNYDLAHCGKGPSDGWCFFSSYNTEQAHTQLEVNASQRDKDFIAAVNWKVGEQCLARGVGKKMTGAHAHNVRDEKTRVAKTEIIDDVKILTPDACPGLVYYLPTPKSPHGVDVDPTGEYIVGGGKLSANIPVHSFSKMKKAIAEKAFDGDAYGIPVLKYDAVLAGEVPKACIGPLHTEFDGKGNAYTSCFLSSEVVKYKLGTFEVVDRIPAFYSIGHLSIPGGDSMQPWGKYLVSLNKITKDRYVPTGPELTQSAQLIDISGEKMKMLLDFPTTGEPHYGQGIPANKIIAQQIRIFPIAENQNPNATKAEKDARVERKPDGLHVYMTAIRSHFMPDNIEGIRAGETVFFHVTNLEQDWDIPHGFTVFGSEFSNLLIMPGETLTLKWVPKKTGVFPFYCTDFCSALHQEMQGYVRVGPPRDTRPLAWSPRARAEK